MFPTDSTKISRINRTLRTLAMGLFSITAVLYSSFALYPQHALAATSSTINFQARLEGPGGNITQDGFYNVQFKLYSATSGGVSLWSETYQDVDGNIATPADDFRVKVINGYLTVSLGSRTAFPTTINWDQNLYLTMNIGGTTVTAAPAFDGEMSPRLALTAVPYAIKAGQLAQANAGGTLTSSLNLLQPTVGNQTFQVADQAAAGTYTLCVQGATNAGGGCATASGSANYIQNKVGGTPQTANFSIVSATSSNPAAYIQGGGGGSDSLIASRSDGAYNLQVSENAVVIHSPLVFVRARGQTSVFTTPLGASLPAVINVPTSDPGNYGSLLGLSIASSAFTTARGILVADGRTVAHQPTIAVLSPDEFSVAGISWEGTNTLGSFKTSDSINSNTADVGISSGKLAGGTSFKSGNVFVASGDTAGTNESSGNIVIDSGSSTGAGTSGVVNIGSLNAPTINVGHNGSTVNLIGTFRVQDASSNALFTVAPTGSVTFGKSNGAAGITGVLVVANSANNNTITLSSATTTASYQLNLPTTIGTAGQCLSVASITSTTGQLGYSGCATATSTLQDVYNNSGVLNPQIQLNGTNGGLKIRDAATSVGNIIDIRGSTGINLLFAVSPGGLRVDNIDTANTGNLGIGGVNTTTIGLSANTYVANDKLFSARGKALFDSNTSYNDVFNVRGSYGNLLTVNSGGKVGINLAGTNLPGLQANGLEIQGALKLTGAGGVNADTFLTPLGSSVATKINIPFYDPGTFGQILALGLPSTAATSSRAISILDARTSAHQPTIGVFSPNESNLIGFSWDGSNTTALIKNTGGNLGIDSGSGSGSIFLQQNGTQYATFSNGTNSLTGSLQVGSLLTPSVDAPGTLNLGSGAATSSITIGKNSITTTIVGQLLVQNATGTPLLTANTTTAQLYVGPVAGDTVGALLVVGNKTNAGDPTAVNGAIYYNSSATGKFRCNEGGIWKNCVGMTDIVDRRWGYYAPAGLSATSLSSSGFLGSPSSSGGSPDTSNPESFYVRYSTSAVSGNVAGASLGTKSTASQWKPKLVARIRSDATVTSMRNWIALGDTDLSGSDGTGNFAGLRYTAGVDTNWQCVSGNGTASTAADTGVQFFGAHQYDIVLDMSTSGTLNCSVSVDGGAYSTVTKSTNLPTATAGLGLQLTTTALSNSSRSMLVSYAYLQQQ